MDLSKHKWNIAVRNKKYMKDIILSEIQFLYHFWGMPRENDDILGGIWKSIIIRMIYVKSFNNKILAVDKVVAINR